jgi:hypothetical protein
MVCERGGYSGVFLCSIHCTIFAYIMTNNDSTTNQLLVPFQYYPNQLSDLKVIEKVLDKFKISQGSSHGADYYDVSL